MHLSSLSLGLLSAAGVVNALPGLGLGDLLWPLKVPNTVVIDGWRLVDAKTRLLLGDRELKTALKHLTAQADSWLSQGPWTVTAKTKPPPNGTIHDYSSQAPYWWPNPDTPDGCPYIQKDGERNPEVDQYQDRVSVGKMFNSTYVLSLAWYYTGEKKYSQHAAEILRTWFLDDRTAMNPNLEHAQIIPCANTGRSIGIIDFSQEYTNVIDAVSILNAGPAPGWTKKDNDKFVDWNRRFLTWLAESPFGVEEASAQNNHGTFANMQIAALAVFTGDRSLAVQRTEIAKGFIDSQITRNGSQPQELARTRSFHYSNFDLCAHLRMALVARKVGVDLFRYKGPEGQTLFKAVDFLVPAAKGGADKWTYPELGFTRYAATDNVRAAAQEGDAVARGAVRKGLDAPPGGDIFGLRPAPEQLDSIATVG
ncbi:alginate lyase domain-containing protein [Trichoderma longibrachiatum]|uniref:Chondroitin AC/alginate lyase n=1 Tax=Trichoderma longibrachiatum ATCC 18648 TaxID=983965 RepID=A0A2T4BVP2_TRILO|nr:chondroitin AC/alginate lyase [Trichoderma longibrachiatum ATCC 18648]